MSVSMTKLKNWWTKLFGKPKKSYQAVPEELGRASYDEILAEIQVEVQREEEKLKRLYLIEFKVLSGQEIDQEEREFLKSIGSNLLSI